MRYVTSGEILDVLEDGAEALVLVDDLLVRGSVVSVDLLWLCETPRTVDELVAHCRQAFGPPPGMGIEDATRAAIAALIEADVLREEP